METCPEEDYTLEPENADGSLKHENADPDNPNIETMCCDPRKGFYRFGGLFFMSFLLLGSYFCYDTPGALQDQIEADMKVSTLQFASLYSMYSWPNVFLGFVGGFLIDRYFGIRLGAIIFATIVTVGQIAYAFGALLGHFWMMEFGRVIFGIGGDSLSVAQNAFAVSWFKGKELNTVFGLQLSMARLGTILNFLSMGPLYSLVNGFEDGHITLGITLLIAGVTCVFSLICAVILWMLDYRRTKVLRLDVASTGEIIQVKDVLTFPFSFWLICIICVCYYVAIFPFIGLGKIFFMQKYDFDEATANGVSSLLYAISGVGAPVCGMTVDKTGRNIFWVSLSILITIICHSMLAFSFINPFIPIGAMGIALALLSSSLWPMVSLVVPEYQLATAFGLTGSVQNAGLALSSMLGGLIVDHMGYFCLEIFYIVLLYLALISSLLIWISNSSTLGIPNASIMGIEGRLNSTSEEQEPLVM